MTRFSSRIGAVAAAVLVTAAISGCVLPKPAGKGTVRYRDVVFSQVTGTTDLTYGSAPNLNTGAAEALKLDMYRPTGDTRRLRPAVVWVHGGGFSVGDKLFESPVPLNLAKRGFVGIAINYRLNKNQVCSPVLIVSCVAAAIHAQHDAQAAVRWLRKNATTYGIDPNRIGIAGHSSGGVVAAEVGMHAEDPGTSGTAGVSSRVRSFVSISGGLPGGLFATADDAPGLLIHGTADPMVSAQNSVDTVNALLKVKVPALYQPLKDAGHDLPKDMSALFDQIAWFFYGSMDLPHAYGQPPIVR